MCFTKALVPLFFYLEVLFIYIHNVDVFEVAAMKYHLKCVLMKHVYISRFMHYIITITEVAISILNLLYKEGGTSLLNF